MRWYVQCREWGSPLPRWRVALANGGNRGGPLRLVEAEALAEDARDVVVAAAGHGVAQAHRLDHERRVLQAVTEVVGRLARLRRRQTEQLLEHRRRAGPVAL